MGKACRKVKLVKPTTPGIGRRGAKTSENCLTQGGRRISVSRSTPVPTVRFSPACLAAPGHRTGSVELNTRGGPFMLTIFGRAGRFCDGVSRRSFLKIGALGVAAGGLTLADIFRAEARAAGNGT